MILMIHTLSWGVVSEDRIEYRTMQECKADIPFMWALMPRDEFGFDGFVECKPTGGKRND